jgi:hypothetical protein
VPIRRYDPLPRAAFAGPGSTLLRSALRGPYRECFLHLHDRGARVPPLFRYKGIPLQVCVWFYAEQGFALQAAPELAPDGGCVLECFAFLRPTPPGVDEAALWPPHRTAKVALAVIAAVERALGGPALDIVVQRVRSPADLAAQVRWRKRGLRGDGC